MKKFIICMFTGTVIMTACSEQDETAVVNDENSEQSNSNDEETPSPQDILHDAISFYDDIDSLYFAIDGATVSYEEDEADERVITHVKETKWSFIEDDQIYTRVEFEPLVQGEEETEEIKTIHISDLDEPSHRFMYEEGDRQAMRFEAVENASADNLRFMASEYGTLLEEAELTYIGEEEINGHMTYQIKAETEAEVNHFWFDQDTSFEIKAESINESRGTKTLVEVMEFEVEPTLDEEIFQLPDDVEAVDGEFEDTNGG